TFTERVIGESKLDGSFVKDSLLVVTKWGLAHRRSQAKGLVASLKKKLGR
ncbi:MAG: polyprenol monophosphomannose synthase, partial [Corynebacterium variabile]